MKKVMLGLIVALFTMSVFADHPDVVVNGQVNLVYTDVIEVSVEDVNGVGQFNHDSPQITVASIDANADVGAVNVDVTSVGNNINATVSDLSLVQGNQNGGQQALVGVANNELTEVNVKVSALNNNASIVGVNDLDLGSVQFNKDSAIEVDVTIVGNELANVAPVAGGNGNNGNGNGNGNGGNNNTPVTVPTINPIVDVTAVGNNLSLSGSVSALNSLQLNQNSPIVVGAVVSGNTTSVGSINTNVTNVGNNLSISVGTP